MNSMPDTLEKRKMVMAWVEQAAADEVDALYQSILVPDEVDNTEMLLQELDKRRQAHLSGHSASYSVEEVRAQLRAMRTDKYGV